MSNDNKITNSATVTMNIRIYLMTVNVGFAELSSPYLNTCHSVMAKPATLSARITPMSAYMSLVNLYLKIFIKKLYNIAYEKIKVILLKLPLYARFFDFAV